MLDLPDVDDEGPQIEYWDLVQASIYLWKGDESEAERVRERRGGVGRTVQDWCSEPGFNKALALILMKLAAGEMTLWWRTWRWSRRGYRARRLDHTRVPASEIRGLEFNDSRSGIKAWHRGYHVRHLEWLARAKKRGGMDLDTDPPPFERAWSLRLDKAEVMRMRPRTPGSVAEEVEAAAIAALTAELRERPDMTRDDAKDFCDRKRFGLSGRGFQDHVWPSARQAAGLPRHAKRGPKGRLSRSSSR